jgi:hypothetical protein
LNERLIKNIAATFPVSGNIVKNLKSLTKELNRHRTIESIPGVRSQGVHKRPIKRRGAQGPQRQRRAIERPQRRTITPNQLANMMNLNLIRIVPPRNRPQRRTVTPNQLANMMNLIRIVPPRNMSLENVMRGLRIRR